MVTADDLTQKAGTAGCISEDGTGGACADGVALENPYSVAVSPDGKSAYVALEVSDAVAVFDRNPTTGALAQSPAPPAVSPRMAPAAFSRRVASEASAHR